jgi:CheY-like chemotaxis protein
MSDTTPRTPTIAVVAADLMFGARIRAAATDAGVAARFARNLEQLTQTAADADLVIIDLDTRWLDAPAAIRALKESATSNATPLVAFVSHVRADLIESARAAGADRVMARSAFVAQLSELLAGLRTR